MQTNNMTTEQVEQMMAAKSLAIEDMAIKLWKETYDSVLENSLQNDAGPNSAVETATECADQAVMLFRMSFK